MPAKKAAKALAAATQPNDGLDAETRTIYKLMADSERYAGQINMLKFGGDVVGQDGPMEDNCRQIDFLVGMMKQKIIIVTGGGPQINRICKERGLPVVNHPVTQYRVTDAETLQICDEVMGQQERRLIRMLNQFAPNVRALPVPAYAGRMVKAGLVKGHEYTGEPVEIDVQLLKSLLDAGITPVISSLGYHPELGMANINADPLAGFIAAKIGAKRLLMCSNTDGVWDANKKRIPELLTSDVPALLNSGVVGEGMKPKVEAAFMAAATMPAGTGVAIINGLRKGAIVQELFSEGGSGTLIHRPDIQANGAGLVSRPA